MSVCMCVHALSYVRLWDPEDCSPPGSSVYGTLQARILEWVAISFSRGSFQPRNQTHVSCVGRQIRYQLSHREAPLVKDTSVFNKWLKR